MASLHILIYLKKTFGKSEKSLDNKKQQICKWYLLSIKLKFSNNINV